MTHGDLYGTHFLIALLWGGMSLSWTSLANSTIQTNSNYLSISQS
jgi:hypothetical protein